jgi:hypothetical protein
MHVHPYATPTMYVAATTTRHTAIMALLFSLLDIMFMCLCFTHKRTLKYSTANSTISASSSTPTWSASYRSQQRKAAKIGLFQLYVYHAFAALFSLLNLPSSVSGSCYIAITAVVCVVLSTSFTLSRHKPLQTSAYTVYNSSNSHNSTTTTSAR